MKIFIKTFFIAILGFMAFSGCTSDKVQVIHNPNVVTNTVPMSSFNDESYIWENWTVSTNQVKNIEQ